MLLEEKIRDEYRNTNISQNKLSDKYQVSISKVRKILNGVKKDKTGILRREFKERGYELLTSDYFHSKQKLKYYCTDKSHGVRTITYSDFNSGRGCGMCAGNQRYDIEFVSQEFLKRGYKLITKEYKNNKQMLEYTCSNKDHGLKEISFDNFLDGHGCSACSGNEKARIEEIKTEFKDRGYTLISDEYKGAHEPLLYYCIDRNHGIRSISYGNFKNGHGCWVCNVRGAYTTTSAESNKEEWSKVPANVYLVELSKEDEVFFKIGITKLDVKERMKSIPYNYELLDSIKTNLYEASLIEGKIHKNLFEHKYLPKIKFPGQNECFLGGEEVEKNIFGTFDQYKSRV